MESFSSQEIEQKISNLIKTLSALQATMTGLKSDKAKRILEMQIRLYQESIERLRAKLKNNDQSPL